MLLHCCRRVLVSKTTLMHLNNAFEVEPGNGHLRDSFLKDRSIETFLIVAPSDKKSSLSVDKVSMHFSNFSQLVYVFLLPI